MQKEIIIESQLEILNQGKSFVETVPETLYQSALAPHFSSSSGKHIRHVIDHYDALITGIEEDVVDYNKRSRDSETESNPLIALQKLNNIEIWLGSLTEAQLNKDLHVHNEISVSSTVVQTCRSNLARELMFVASHAVHHYSLISAMISLQGSETIADFGVAPATLSHQRQQEATN